MNQNRYQVVEFSRNSPYGIDNRIVASAATLRGCLSQYNKHVNTWKAAKIERKNLIKTVFLCDGVEFNTVTL